ncbi:uncharacterized protein MYCFIDRAFT_186086 [Pseudocercospora fijiensis CIRAD86]|uniref:Enoyl reductase (ER) domain-containing protein n=1 Tax=Pseudocercospora fijiensis (strain CIRAD86) TaxID=383855 RepID=M3ALK5_PSEFD|nr:uncharacterized protein MYCFIDRAFT_186086 [Pseudocercospora fijiensis CIRAD86]EME85476.1 hypothetical protein MYCFIDRAFT_186086 [Pseudocercospora fijiensis CIRAD86]
MYQGLSYPNTHSLTTTVILDPVDYKPVELPFFTLFIKKPPTPVIDFAGKMVQPADGSKLQPGQVVFGAVGPGIAGGALAEYATASPKTVVPVPAGISPIDASGVCAAGLSAYQTIVPYTKEGSNVFINGGSGGTGVYGIQIAKAKGCYSSGRKYDHVVDNVGANMGLFWKCHEYTRPGAIYVSVGALLSFKFLWEAITTRIWPGFLGGGKRKLQGFFLEPKTEDLAQIATWMQEGKVKTIIDEKFTFEEAPKAFTKLKTGRAKGKIVVEVAPTEA